MPGESGRALGAADIQTATGRGGDVGGRRLRERIIEQALRDGDEAREMEAYLDHLFSTPRRLNAMIEEARRRVDEEEGSSAGDNVIPLQRRLETRKGGEHGERL